MGSSKSFRMTDRIENMFNSIKKYSHTDVSDTEILSTGIEIQFEMAAQTHNPYYRSCIIEYLKDDKMVSLFNSICDILEALSFSDGYYLEDEMKYFMTAVEADRFFEGYEELEKINSQQYHKALEIVLNKAEYSEKDVQLLAEKLEQYYEEKK